MIRQGKLSNYDWSMNGKRGHDYNNKSKKKKKFLKTDAELVCLIKNKV